MGERIKAENILKTKMMSRYLVDTTLLVEMLRGNTQAKKFLEKLPEISKVSLVELIQGCHDKEELRVVKKACDLLPQVKIDTAISEMAIYLISKYYLSHELFFLDAMIAATCIIEKKILVTENI